QAPLHCLSLSWVLPQPNLDLYMQEGGCVVLDGEQESPLWNFRSQSEITLRRVITKTVPNLAREHLEQLINELQIHQMELAMQSQELELARRDAEDSRDRYRHMYESAPVAYFTLDAHCRIREMNEAAVALLGF